MQMHKESSTTHFEPLSNSLLGKTVSPESPAFSLIMTYGSELRTLFPYVRRELGGGSEFASLLHPNFFRVFRVFRGFLSSYFASLSVIKRHVVFAFFASEFFRVFRG